MVGTPLLAVSWLLGEIMRCWDAAVASLSIADVLGIKSSGRTSVVLLILSAVLLEIFLILVACSSSHLESGARWTRNIQLGFGHICRQGNYSRSTVSALESMGIHETHKTLNPVLCTAHIF